MAIQLKEKTGARITAITMGPTQAVETLRIALSMGVDKAILLSDKAFSGADVYATAYTIAQGIKADGCPDLVLCGQQTSDGDTAQVPFSLAVQLEIPCMGWIKSISSVTSTSIMAVQEVTGGTTLTSSKFPCLLAFTSDCAIPRIPTITQRMKAKRVEIKVLGLEDLQDTNSANYGISGSPTRVKRIFSPVRNAKFSPIVLTPEEVVRKLMEEIKCQF